MTRREIAIVDSATAIFIALLPDCKNDPTRTVQLRYDAVHHARGIVDEATGFVRLKNEIEQHDVMAALRETNMNATEAARHLGITRDALYQRVRRLGVTMHKLRGLRAKN